MIVGSADKTLVVLIFHFLPDDPSSPHAAAPMGDGEEKTEHPGIVCACPLEEFSYSAPRLHSLCLASFK